MNWAPRAHASFQFFGLTTRAGNDQSAVSPDFSRHEFLRAGLRADMRVTNGLLCTDDAGRYLLNERKAPRPDRRVSQSGTPLGMSSNTEKLRIAVNITLLGIRSPPPRPDQLIGCIPW